MTKLTLAKKVNARHLSIEVIKSLLNDIYGDSLSFPSIDEELRYGMETISSTCLLHGVTPKKHVGRLLSGAGCSHQGCPSFKAMISRSFSPHVSHVMYLRFFSFMKMCETKRHHLDKVLRKDSGDDLTIIECFINPEYKNIIKAFEIYLTYISLDELRNKLGRNYR